MNPKMLNEALQPNVGLAIGPASGIKWWDEFFGGAPKNTRGARVLPGEKRSQRFGEVARWIVHGFDTRKI